MAEPTYSLQELRRELCGELRMPFHRRFPDGSTLTKVAQDDKVFDTNLTQKRNRWKGHWLYMVDGDAAGDFRQIRNFDDNDEAMTLEYDLSATPSTGDAYEIMSIWTPNDIHRAINSAIQEGFPAFFDVEEDETIILEEDTLEYDLSGLTRPPWRILKIWFEKATGSLTGTADSGGNNTLTDSDLAGELGDVDTSWKISVYAGTGSGQLRDVSSVNDSTGEVTVSSNWTTNPDSTSKYRLWDPSGGNQTKAWERLTSAQFDTYEWPNTLYLLGLPSDFNGLRMRLQYAAEAESLSAEDDTTVVPKEFIKHWAIQELAGMLTNDNRYDRQRFSNIQEYHRQLAQREKVARAFEMPDSTIWKDHGGNMGSGAGDADPLDWDGDIGGFTF